MKSICVLQNKIISQRAGGYEIQIYNIFKGLHERGWKVIYVTDGERNGCFELDGIHVYTHPKKHFFPFYNPSLFKLLQSINCSLVYQRSRTPYSYGNIGIRYSKRKNVKFIFSIGSPDDFDTFNSISDIWKRNWPFWKKVIVTPDAFLKDFLFIKNIKMADLLIVQNQYQKKACLRLFNKESKIINTGHPIPTHKLQKSNPLTVCWVANIRRIKQPELFLKLAKLCGDLYLKYKIKFVMVAGERINDYENQQMISDVKRQINMDIYGGLTIDQANTIMENASILVNTSQYEGFSNTYIQAWMRETPVVTLHCDPDGVIEKYKLGFHSRSFEQMVIDVRRLIEDEELRRQMGRNARAYAIENHDITKTVEHLDHLFTTCLNAAS